MQKQCSQRRVEWEYFREAGTQTLRSVEKEGEQMCRFWSRDSPAPCGEVMEELHNRVGRCLRETLLPWEVHATAGFW